MALSEFELIREYFARPVSATTAKRADVLLGIGDDAAVLQTSPGSALVVAVDTLVDGVHFPSDLPARHIAYRALAVNLSDAAAMGATPRWFTLSMTLSAAPSDWLREFADALLDLAAHYDVALIGGDTTRGPLSVSVQIIGEAPGGKVLRRDGAEVGDRVFVSGVPGLAALGLKQWCDGVRTGVAVERFLRPQPRVSLGQSLIGLASAAIDISDGLWADLGHILSASGVGAHLDVTALPSCTELSAIDVVQGRQLSLCGGDDYELCFTVPRRHCQAARDRAAGLGIEIREIGEIIAGTGIEAPDLDSTELPTNNGGYRHF